MYYIIKFKKLTYDFEIFEKIETLICCLKKTYFFHCKSKCFRARKIQCRRHESVCTPVDIDEMH